MVIFNTMNVSVIKEALKLVLAQGPEVHGVFKDRDLCSASEENHGPTMLGNLLENTSK